MVVAGEQVENFSIGDRVVVPFNNACGACPCCLDGNSHVCADGRGLGFSPDLPGAFATEFKVPHADFNAVHLPEGASPVEMAGLGCRFAVAYHALAHKADVRPGRWVSIHGCGGLGISAVHLANALGARVVATDLNDDNLAMAERLGADATVNASTEDSVSDEIRDVTNGGATISIDALGIEETCRNSLMSVEKLGQHVQIGMTTTDKGILPVSVDHIVNNEIEFVGVKGMPPHQYDEIIGMVASGSISPGALVTNRVGLGDVSNRLAAMDDSGTTGIEVVTQFD